MEPGSSRSSHDSVHEIGDRAVESSARGSMTSSRIEQIPRQIGLLLLASGMITGMLPPPPGPFDVSLMLVGGVALWPRALGTLERWTERTFPQAHHAGVSFIERFLDDLEHRYPGSTV
jgi:hypothetical protein